MSVVKTLCLLILMFSFSARATELFENQFSIRALGMGNAYTAIVDDGDSLYYNPAGLMGVSGLNWTVLDPFVGADGGDIYSVITDARSSSTYAATLRKLFGKKVWVGAGTKSAVTMRGFGIGIYDSLNFSANLKNPAFPTLTVSAINDYAMVMGVAFKLIPDVIDMGFTGRRITRVGGRIPIGVETLSTLSNQDVQNRLANQGSGIGLDMGVNLHLPSSTNPTLSFVWKDVGNTTFVKETGVQAPPMQTSEMIFGYGMEIDALILKVRPTLDYKHMNEWNEVVTKKIHAGIEFELPVVSMRGGLHQGYYTAGLGLNFGLFRMDFATWGVEQGEHAGQDEDRRYAAQLKVELTFDPDFNFSPKNRLKMKPRR